MMFMVGEHIEAEFSDLDASPSDWIGIFSQNEPNENYIYWLYTNGEQEYSYDNIESGIISFSPISLPTGVYEIRLFYNNSYEIVTSYEFIVTDSSCDVVANVYDDSFRVMTFNTWYSAQYGYGGLERVAEVVAYLDVDIVGFQETNPYSALEIQSLLSDNFEGYEELYATASEASIPIISRFPIIEIYDYDLYGIGAKIITPTNDTLKFISSHLTAYPYGPYSLYEGYSVEEVLNDEMMYRYQENLDIYNQIIINENNAPHLSVIYVGDHNTPSSLDWGSESINQNFGFEVEWPVSDFLLSHGFFDSYRETHPSPYDKPGLTWSPGYPKNTFDSWDVHDRIDMIYYKDGDNKQLHPIGSFEYDCDPWPSDHRAVVTEFAFCSLAIDGDINLDDDVDILDVISLVNEILYPSSLYCILTYSDMDANQEVNILDVIAIVNLILDI